MVRLTLLAVIGLIALVAMAGWWITDRVEGEYFESGDVRLHYTDEGSGRPIVLLHGFAVNSDLNWRLPGVTQALTPHFRVISLDLRGHGLSGKPRETERYGQLMADDVIALLDHLKLKRVHLVGYSLGGIITLKLATTHPDRLWTASPLGAGWENPQDSSFFTALDGIAEALESGSGVPPLSASLDGTREPPGFIHTAWVKIMTRYLNDGPALAAMVRALPGLTIERADLARLEVPICSIVGSLDTMKLGVDSMVGVVPDHTVVVIDGADHLAATSSPLLIESLLEFLRSHHGDARPEKASS